MFGIDSRERQAHHLFTMMNQEQCQRINNHEFIGKAAAYFAASEFTDYVEAVGLPRTQVEAQTLIIGFARDFINSNVEQRGLRLDKGKVLSFALESLRKTIHNPNPTAWRVRHTTLGKAFRDWATVDKEYRDDYERWEGEEFNYGAFGPQRIAPPPAPLPPPPPAQMQKGFVPVPGPFAIFWQNVPPLAGCGPGQGAVVAGVQLGA